MIDLFEQQLDRLAKKIKEGSILKLLLSVILLFIGSAGFYLYKLRALAVAQKGKIPNVHKGQYQQTILKDRSMNYSRAYRFQNDSLIGLSNTWVNSKTKT